VEILENKTITADILGDRTIILDVLGIKYTAGNIEGGNQYG
jgi:hypothetical protein